MNWATPIISKTDANSNAVFSCESIQNCKKYPNHKNGFTLIELLLVLVILSILFSLSLPNFQDMYEARKADIVIKKVAQAIQLARVSAIRSGKVVTLCRSDGGVECGGRWQDGIIVFSDGNGDRIINQDDELQHYITFPGINGSLRWRAFQNRQYLQITNQGFTRYQNGNFTYCPNDGNASLARQLIINRTARIRFATDSDGDGIREDSRGRPISCS